MTTTARVSRRKFLIGGGAVVAAATLSATLGELGRAAAESVVGSGSLPAAGEVDNQWVVVQAANPHGTGTAITVYTPKVELGTGTETALQQIVAEELYATLTQLTWVQGDTDFDPPSDSASEGYTAGSQTIYVEGVSLRLAAAAAFQEILALGATYFGVPASDLRAANGVLYAGHRSASYGQVIGGQVVTAAPTSTTPTKPYQQYTIVGQPVPRVDLPSKFFAQFTYSTDVRLPGMVYARVVRPVGRNATFAGWGALYGLALSYPGIIGISQVGNFVYVLSSDEGTAAQVVTDFGSQIADWTDGPALIAEASLPSALQSDEYVYASDDQVDVGNAASAFAGAPVQLAAQYFTPFYMHGPMGGSAAVATYDGTTLTVYSGTQGPGPLQAAIAALIQTQDPGFGTDNVHVIYTEQPGCYGHDGADDCSAEAALIAYLIQGPVKVQWSRADEHQWEPLSPAMVHLMQGGLDGDTVVSWQHDMYSPTHNSRPGAGAAAGNLLVSQYLGATPAPMPQLGPNTATRNAPVNYNFANSRVGRHFVTSFTLQADDADFDAASPLTWVLPRSTALRSLGGFSNTFANESFMDELAYAAGVDPVAFRISYLQGNTRAIEALAAVALLAAWVPAQFESPGAGASPYGPGPGPYPLGPPPPAGHAVGRGVSFIQYENDLTYVATVADVDVALATGVVSVLNVYVAHDCGLIINPDGLENQIQGNVIQGVSRTLIEQVNYVGDAVVQNGWYDYAPYYVTGYPVIQFDQVPNTRIALLDHPDQPAWGAGEPAVLPMAGALGNAIHAATGVRIRSLPMTPTNVLAALQAANVPGA